jgi:hypothetical protein
MDTHLSAADILPSALISAFGFLLTTISSSSSSSSSSTVFLPFLAFFLAAAFLDLISTFYKAKIILIT